MASHTTRTTLFRKRNRYLAVLAAFAFSFSAIAGTEGESEFQPPSPMSEYLPAAPGEPPVDFCSDWNPEFGYRGYRCCSNSITRSLATTRRRRRANSCAPNRMKWQFCGDQTDAQKDYVAGVKDGSVDALEAIQKSMGSKGGQSFCGPSNGFLVEGRPLVPTDSNRIELRNEARCANYGTDPLVGALEWMGREIKREFHETEFDKARLIIGDLSAPKGGCIAGRAGRRAHKSHTGGLDVDFAFFNPRSTYPPEERFTRTFYVASNWWMLKKLFKNPFACVKIVFIDRGHIRALERYAKTDPDWTKIKPFVRHVRGHRDHFHLRVGSGPGVPGCASDPTLEEDEDPGDETEHVLALSPIEGAMEDAANEGAEESPVSGTMSAAPEDDAKMDARRGVASIAGVSSADAAIPAQSGVQLVAATLPAHKLEPAITAQFAEKKRRRRPSSHTRKRRR